MIGWEWLGFYAFIGALAGLGAGLFGIGGGAIMVPVLILGFGSAGMPAELLVYMAIATSLATVIFTQSSAALGHWRRGVVSPQLVLAMAPGMLCGGILGAFVARQLPADALQWALAVFLSLVALHMLLERRPRARFPLPGRASLLGIGGGIGVVSAMFGIGGGALTVPLFNLCGLAPVRAIANAAACGLFMALGASAAFTLLGAGIEELPPYSLGFIYLPALACLVCSALFFSGLGVRLAHLARPRTLKVAFALVVLVAVWQEWLFSGIRISGGALYYEGISPVALRLGPLAVHWYGLLYLLAFLLCWRLALRRSRRPGAPLAPEQVESLVLYTALGVILGGRCGYVLFYGLERFLAEPLWLFAIQDGGMSFHGGLLGVVLALWVYALRQQTPAGEIMDFVAPLVPVGLGLGRFGNFINQELWGRVSDVPWAVVFGRDPWGLPRHPSQLYELLLEGALLYWVLQFFVARRRPAWATTAVFAIGYGVLRFLVEFLREPDAPTWHWMSRGQLLSLPLAAGGVMLLLWAYRETLSGRAGQRT